MGSAALTDAMAAAAVATLSRMYSPQSLVCGIISLLFKIEDGCISAVLYKSHAQV